MTRIELYPTLAKCPCRTIWGSSFSRSCRNCAAVMLDANITPTLGRLWSRAPRWGGAVIATVVACGSSCVPSRPAAFPRASGVLEVGPGDSTTLQPLQVILASPQQTSTSRSTQINLVFNKPVRPLTAAGDAPVPRITIEPAIRGSWQWQGTQSLAFVPEQGAVMPATRYRVSVPAETAAVDGTLLSRPFDFSFETERPRLEHTTWKPIESGLLTPASRLLMDFDLPVEADVLGRSVHLVASQNGKSPRNIALSARRAAANDATLLEVVPSERLPLDSEIQVSVSEDLQCALGPLPMGEAKTFSSRTYGPPQVSLSCPDAPEACALDPVLTFATPVPNKVLARSIRITPAVRWQAPGEGSSTHIVLDAPFVPGRPYTVQVTPFVDAFGQKEETVFRKEFVVALADPATALGAYSDFCHAWSP